MEGDERGGVESAKLADCCRYIGKIVDTVTGSNMPHSAQGA
jgi:hypothetical protein